MYSAFVAKQIAKKNKQHQDKEDIRIIQERIKEAANNGHCYYRHSLKDDRELSMNVKQYFKNLGYTIDEMYSPRLLNPNVYIFSWA